MSLQIQWTPIALQSLSEVFEYTYKTFGERQLRKLTRRIHDVTHRLVSFPLLGKREENLIEATNIEYRSIVVISEIKLLYTISDNSLFIEYVKNTKMDDATMLEKINSLEDLPPAEDIKNGGASCGKG